MSMRRGLAGAAGWATAVRTSLAAVAPSASEASAPVSRLRRSIPVALNVGDSAQHEQPRKNRCEREDAAMIYLPDVSENLLGFGCQASTCDEGKLRGRDMTIFGFGRRMLA